MRETENRLHHPGLQPPRNWVYLCPQGRLQRHLTVRENFMEHTLVPVALFVCVTFCITYAIKLLVNARVRIKMLQACDSRELIESIVRGEDHLGRMSSLRWGLVLALEGLGFGIIQMAGWTTITAGVVAVLLGAFGLGSLIYFVAAQRLQ
jgi:hypothetical protein